MKTTINNFMRVYQVTTSTGKQAFCNIEDLKTEAERIVTEWGQKCNIELNF